MKEDVISDTFQQGFSKTNVFHIMIQFKWNFAMKLLVNSGLQTL